MNYVEWLKVRNCLRTVAIVLGVLLVLGLAARVWFGVNLLNGRSVVERINSDPGTVTTHTTYHGMPRTIMVNAREHTRITIDRNPGGGTTITIVEPKSQHQSDENDSIGSVKITTTTGSADQTTVINTNGSVPLDLYLSFACVMGLIIATVFGTSFARENDGHLEDALLKPVSRERYAFGLMAADFAAILGSMVLLLIAMVIGQAFFETPHVDFAGIHAWFAATVVLVPFGWWALLNAASASLKRGAGAVLGFSWPVAIVIITLAHSNITSSSLGQAIHAIAWGLSRLIPLSYSTYNSDHAAPSMIHTGNVLIALALVIVYGALVIVQRHRVEA